jgi:hypothetical protein
MSARAHAAHATGCNNAHIGMLLHMHGGHIKNLIKRNFSSQQQLALQQQAHAGKG